MDVLYVILVIAGAYLFGAIPTAYWMGRLIKGIDLRRYGSGNVGISNFSRHVGKRWAVVVALFDVAVKGPVPVLIASSKVLDLGIEVEAAAGFATIAGHTWSVFIRFSGGRGMGTVLGVAGAFSFFLVWAYILTSFTIWLAIGRRDSAVSWGIAAALMPVYSVILRMPVAVTLFTVGFLAVTVVKRAVTNDPRRLLPVAGTRARLRLLAIRVAFDRDTLSKEEWVSRGPVAASEVKK
jgi:glycerol-3-phosphate acyltransferase PlsY